MKIPKITFSICIILFWSQHPLCGGFLVLDILLGIEEFQTYSEKLNILVTGEPDEKEKLMTAIKSISDQLTKFQGSVEGKLNAIETLVQLIPGQVIIRDMILKIRVFVADINDKWDDFISRVVTSHKSQVLNDFTFSIYNNVKKDLTTFREYVVSTVWLNSFDKGIFQLIADHAAASRDISCGQGETYHTILYRLLNIVLLAELKSLMLLFFAYDWRFTSEAIPFRNDSMNDFKVYSKLYIQAFRTSLVGSKPYLRNCDPKNGWKRNHNFIELAGLFFESIYYRETTDDWWETNASATMHPITNSLKCFTRLSGFERLYPDLFGSVRVCVARPDYPYEIEWIYHKNYMGPSPSGSCDNNRLFSTDPLGSYSYFRCNCTHPSKWQFNRKLHRSNTQKNHVIVGVSFWWQDGALLISIAQGKLEAAGHISKSTWSWIIEPDNERNEYINFDRRAFFFGDLQLPDGYVLTGVKLISKTINGVDGIALGIQGTKFDYDSGKLQSDTKMDLEQSTPAHWKEAKPYRRGYTYYENLPTSPNRFIPDPIDYTFVRFQQSLLQFDYGQGTVPPLESSYILTSPLAPLGGVGVYFKKDREDYFSGFIALRVFSIDYSHIVDSLEDYANN